MSHNLLLNASFHCFLLHCDQISANQSRVDGCPYCGGKLHRANYPRKVIGIQNPHREHYQHRFSFCCQQCRRRTTPPSMRFLGRFRYTFALIIVMSAMQSHSASRLRRLQIRYDIQVPPLTLQRWKSWWQGFIQSSFWQTQRGLFSHSQNAAKGNISRWLLRQFHGSLLEKLLRLMAFLMPLSVPGLHII